MQGDIITEVRDKPASDRSQLDGPTEATDLDKTDANKRLITRFVNEVLIAGDYDRITDFMTVDCGQHNPGIRDGIAPIRAFAADASMRYIELHNVIGSGDFVAALAESEFYGKRHAVIDLFRVENDMVVEHWDVIEEIAEKHKR